MANTEETGRKWSCEYCTYENWPASRKCTLCHAPKHPQIINKEPVTAEQDIYKMASLVSSQAPSCSSSIGSNLTSTANKWACQICTYLNWPKSQKCTQCLNTRPKITTSVTQTKDHSIPLNINVNIEGAIKGAAKGSPHISPRTSPNSPEAAKALNNEKNLSVAPSTSKWLCKACTYENWPKSNKCVLCGIPRGKLYSPDTASGPSGILNDTELGSNKNAQNLRRSPPPVTIRNQESNYDIQGGATALPPAMSPTEPSEGSNRRREEKRLKQLRSRMRDSDWLWLRACQGIVEGDRNAVEGYLASGGDPTRHLTAEDCHVLNRPSAYQVGFTLIYLAVRFSHEDILAVLLAATDVSAKTRKRVPPHISPDMAADILRGLSSSLRQRKGDFPCYFFTEITTFSLPPDIVDLPRPVQKQLFDELLDNDVQKELEVDEPIINWSLELTERLGSRLYALWNRTAGDCLLDSALQATWGVFDRDNTLRRALAESLSEGANMFYPRWKETESMQAQLLHFTLDESQWQQDWAILLSLASQPGSSLEQIHIFALAHILRRPIIVYGIKFVKSFRGENIGIARFQGVYLPLLWESSFCWKTPIALGYTRGHFSALVPMETDTGDDEGAGANIQKVEEGEDESQVVYLPLTDFQGKLLDVHFLSATQLGHQEAILREWLDCCVTDNGLLVARTKLHRRPLLVRQMLDEWMDRYRRLSRLVQRGTQRESSRRHRNKMSSEEDSDEE